MSSRESELDTREVRLKAHETDLAATEKRLKIRTEELAAQTRAAATAEPRTGFFDFALPKQRGPIRLTKADARGVWPSRDCVIVAVTPLDRDEVPQSFASSCSSEAIVLEKPHGARDGRRVRMVWQLNETKPNVTTRSDR